jgi:succinyl-diaminopimelate desuccinylase
VGDAPRYRVVPGATGGTFLRALADVPIVTVGPGDRAVPHEVNEVVRTHGLVTAARVYAAATIVYLGGVT